MLSLPILKLPLAELLVAKEEGAKSLGGKLVEVILSLRHQLPLSVLQPLHDDIVRTLAVQSDLSLVFHNHRHPFPHIVEVEDAEKLMSLRHAERLDGDGARCAPGEDKTKVARGGHKCILVWRLRLVLQLAIWEIIIVFSISALFADLSHTPA